MSLDVCRRATTLLVDGNAARFNLQRGDRAELLGALFALNDPVDGPALYIGASVSFITDEPVDVALAVFANELQESRMHLIPFSGRATYNVKDIRASTGHGIHRVSIVVHGPSQALARNVRLTIGNAPEPI